ncbi:MAG: hypothetical protein ACFKPT_31870 [Gloeotrichia echinulata GP01]
MTRDNLRENGCHKMKRFNSIIRQRLGTSKRAKAPEDQSADLLNEIYTIWQISYTRIVHET